MKGITVILTETVQTGTDAFGAPIFGEVDTPVKNVLVGEPSTDDVTNSLSLYGKKITFMLGIPKGDTHIWKDKKVRWNLPNGQTMKAKTFGFPITGIEANIPTPWHMKVRCEAYE